MPATLGAITELSHIRTVDTIFSLAVQELLLFSQTSIANAMDHRVGHRLSLIEGIELAGILGVRELSNVTAPYGELSLSVFLLLRGCQACVPDMFDELICRTLAIVGLDRGIDLLGTGLRL